MTRFFTVCLSAVLVAAASAGAPVSFAPAGWDADMKLAEAPDLNPDPQILGINLTARLADVIVAGKRVRAWTYNGGIPVPSFVRSWAIG